MWMQNNPGQDDEEAKRKAERPGIGNTNTDFLLPWAILQYLHPRVRQRLDADRVRHKCLFDALIMKHKSNAIHWESKRYLVWQCSTGQWCGGLGDRVKGIFSVFFHAVAIGYEFRIDWTNPIALYPDFLVPSTMLNWTGGTDSEWSRSSPALRIMDQNDKPFGLCEWRNMKLVKIQTNGNPIPQECDQGDVKVRQILMNQSFTTSCIRTATEPWTGGVRCMGCIWWYLFRVGLKLKERLVIEFEHLQSWRVKRKLGRALSIGMHVRAGDSHMQAGNGRENHNISALVASLEACAYNFSRTLDSERQSFFLIVVSDSERVKELVGQWDWLHVYPSRIRPFHIDRYQNLAQEKMVDAAMSAFVDVLFLGLQDVLLLSGSSGYGFLAQSVGLFDHQNSIQCVRDSFMG
jgi:hypothetical protein